MKFINAKEAKIKYNKKPYVKSQKAALKQLELGMSLGFTTWSLWFNKATKAKKVKQILEDLNYKVYVEVDSRNETVILDIEW